MNKLTKLSLVAAVAVAGFTTSASAVALEEAIKGVDVSGMVRYRLETAEGISNGINTSGKTSLGGTIGQEQAHRYTAVLNTATPMGDFSKANLGFRVDGTTSNATADVNAVAVNLTTANYQLQLNKTTVIAGKQYLNTPLTHNGWDTGTGILALNTDTPVTLAAGFFANQADTTVATLGAGSNNTAVLAAIGKLGMVDAQLWYFNIQNVANAYFVELATKVANVSLKAQYVNTKYENDATGVAAAAITSGVAGNAAQKTVAAAAGNADEHTFMGLEASTTLGTADITVAYTATGDEGGAVTIDDGHNDAALISIGEQAQAAGTAEAASYGLAVMAPVFAGLSLGADVAALTNDGTVAEDDLTELVLRAAYKVDKKFSVSAFYSTADSDSSDKNLIATRVEAKYKF